MTDVVAVESTRRGAVVELENLSGKRAKTGASPVFTHKVSLIRGEGSHRRHTLEQGRDLEAFGSTRLQRILQGGRRRSAATKGSRGVSRNNIHSWSRSGRSRRILGRPRRSVFGNDGSCNADTGAVNGDRMQHRSVSLSQETMADRR